MSLRRSLLSRLRFPRQLAQPLFAGEGYPCRESEAVTLRGGLKFGFVGAGNPECGLDLVGGHLNDVLVVGGGITVANRIVAPGIIISIAKIFGGYFFAFRVALAVNLANRLGGLIVKTGVNVESHRSGLSFLRGIRSRLIKRLYNERLYVVKPRMSLFKNNYLGAKT